jgi:hypothetical protein
MPRVRTPKILWGSTSRRVLTMEWIDGVKLTNRWGWVGGWVEGGCRVHVAGGVLTNGVDRRGEAD